jgi:hypothetical protein
LEATPLNTTVWLPAERLAKVTLELIPTDWLFDPSTVAV